MNYRVEVEVYEGPLDLLLYLIKKEELDIYDIPVSKIAEKYFEYIKLMRILDLDVAGEFLVMASTLMHIKSRMLLPEEELTEEDEEDPREALTQQLLEYRKYIEAADSLQEMELHQQNIFTRPEGDEQDEHEIFIDVSLFDLINALSGVLKRFDEEPVREIVQDEVTVKQRIEFIKTLLEKEETVNFTELFATSKSRNEAIATFMALLELIKLQTVKTRQKTSFGKIYLYKPSDEKRVSPDGAELKSNG